VVFPLGRSKRAAQSIDRDGDLKDGAVRSAS
jgi:hypothetical protein